MGGENLEEATPATEVASFNSSYVYDCFAACSVFAGVLAGILLWLVFLEACRAR